MKGDTVQPKYTLIDLGYHFNKAGELRSIENDAPFQFVTQEGYELLGDAMTHEVYDLLEKLGLQRVPLKKPGDAGNDNEFSFVFCSPHFDSKSTLLVLLHGSGAVRAGQWGRRLIINENLDRGSQIPYIERAMANDWGVLVMNTNNNMNVIEDHEVPLRYSKDSTMHAINCWYRFVKYARASRIFVVAHSRGGQDISRIVDEFPNDNRIEVVCLTDATFHFSNNRASHPITINWAAQPLCSMARPILGDPKNLSDRVHQIWAGTDEHDRSSYMAHESIFHVLEHFNHRNDIDCLLIEAWDIVVTAFNEQDGKNGEESCSAADQSTSFVAEYSSKCSGDYVVQEGIVTDFNVSGDIIYDETSCLDPKTVVETVNDSSSLKRKSEIEKVEEDCSQVTHPEDSPVAKKLMVNENSE